MEKYSHGAFEVSGYHVRIGSPENEREVIMNAWKDFFTDAWSERISDKAYPTVHAVYYNYHDTLDLSKKWYDMLIGYITTDGVTQTDASITTIHIPAQDYRYTTTTDITPENIFGTWNTINHTPASELPRSYGYDLDMYNETHSSLTIAVSVDEKEL